MKFLNHIIIAFLFLLAIPVCSCSGVRDLVKADSEMPVTFMPGLETDSASIADMKWWEFYSDSTLCTLIRTGLENNRDLLKAAARVEEARQMYGITKANMYPELSASIKAQDEMEDYNGTHFDHDPQYDLKLTVSWEWNLWGSLSWAKKAGGARYMASEDDYRAMRVTLIAEIASTYFRLIALDNELNIVKQTLITREESLEQARLRFQGGLTSETIYQQAMVEYATTAALVPGLEHRRNAVSNALTLLLGEYPHIIAEGSLFPLFMEIPHELPTGFPSTLLQRRPDLKASEHRLQAAMADVGVAYANRFPSFKISLTAGLENESLGNFFKSPYVYPIASVVAPLLDFNRRKRKYKASIAQYEQARLDYEKNVITAFTEVNTGLDAFRKARRTKNLKTELRDAAAKYVQLAHLQYRGGTLNYIDVLDAQRRYFDAQISVSNALRDEYLAIINLYRVLGGGW